MELNECVEYLQTESNISTALSPEETLVSDARAELSPAELVDHKLASLLESVPLSVSSLMETSSRRTLS